MEHPDDSNGGIADDWATVEGLAAIRRRLEERIRGWRTPAAYGVALDGEFPHVNRPGGGLPAVVLATVLEHDGATATVPMTRAQLDEAINALRPAEACTEVPHPNLAAWRAVASAYDERGGVLEAVFVRDLADPVTSATDAALRGASA